MVGVRRSVVEVVTDDMPFLVDSVTMELNRLGHNVHVVIHPQFSVERDITGALREVALLDDDGRPSSSASLCGVVDARRDRPQDADEAAAIEEGLQRVLRDVRESVEDWDKMHAQVLAVVAELEDNPPPLPEAELDQGREFLAWLADDHFTFLGYREYQLEADEDSPRTAACAPSPAPASASCAHDQDLSSAFAKLPPLVKAKAREKTLLVLAKANSRATVHRPAYLDYVGVKTFDAARRGRRRAPLPRPVLQRRLHRVGQPGARCCARRPPRSCTRPASTRAATPARR